MKQAVSRKKAVSPLPRKSYDQPKTAKKTVAAAVKSAKSVSAKTIKSVAVKPAPIVSAPRKASPKTVVQNQTTADKPLKIANLNKKMSVNVSKTKLPAAAPSVKQTAKKAASKAAGISLKTTTAKTKPNIAAGKKQPVKIVAATAESKVAAQKAETKTSKIASKISAVKSNKPTAQAKVKPAKIQVSEKKILAAKNSKMKAGKIVAPNKIVEKSNNLKISIPAKKISADAPKLKTIAKSKNDAVQKIAKAQPIVAVGKKSRKSPKIAAPIVVEKAVRTPKIIQPVAVQSAAKSNAKKIQSSITPTIVKAATAKDTNKNAKTIATAPVKKMKAIVPPLETVAPIAEIVELPVPKPRKKKIKPIGAAIFRGIKERYDFQVFPADGEFEDAAAIYIISRRVVDKNKRAHHKMVCIGQADSILSELKKHRKGKCFKRHQANAISVLREENEAKRLKIAADLMSAHAIPCPHI